MRLLADENIQEPTVRYLRNLGYEVLAVRDEGLRSARDDAVFAHAQKTGCTVLTHNVDFTDLRDLIGKHHCGIIRLRISNQRTGFMHPILQGALKRLEKVDLKDTLVTVTDRRIRMRHTFFA